MEISGNKTVTFSHDTNTPNGILMTGNVYPTKEESLCVVEDEGSKLQANKNKTLWTEVISIREGPLSWSF